MTASTAPTKDKLRLRDNPTALTAATVALWSCGSVLGKLMSEQEGYLTLVLGFIAASCAILLLRPAMVGRPFSRKLLRPAPIAVGMIGYGLYWICYFRCFRASSSAALPVVFNYTWPIFTVFFSHLIFSPQDQSSTTVPRLRRKTLLVEMTGMLIGLLGIWSAVSSGAEGTGPMNFEVIGWGLGAGASYGIFSAYCGLVSKDDQLDFLLLALVASAVFLFIFALEERNSIAQLSWSDVIVIILFGVGSEAFGSLFWVRANSQARTLGLEVSRAASLIFFLPLFSLVIISLVFKDSTLLRPGFFAGCLLVTACVAVCGRAREIATRLSPV